MEEKSRSSCLESPRIPYLYDSHQVSRALAIGSEYHVIADDEQQAKAAIQLYNDRAAKYNSSWHSTFTQTLASMLPLSPGQQVLDLACGTGLLSFNLGALVGPTGRVVGVDITPAMLKEAYERKEAEGEGATNVEFHECDVMKLGTLQEAHDGPAAAVRIKEESFDAVTMASALVLFNDPVAVIRLMASYLKPGGLLAVDAAHPRNLLGGILMEKVGLRMGMRMPYYRSWVTSGNSLRDLLEMEGLVVEKYRFVEQQGYGKRYHDLDQADRFFDEMLMQGSPQSRPFKEKGPEVLEKARELFREEWRNSAVMDDDGSGGGKVEEVDGVYVAVARKPKPPTTTSEEPLSSQKQNDANNEDDGDSNYPAFKGGCLCGAVRYASSKLPECMVSCHCSTCGRLSGCGFLPFADLPRSVFRYTSCSTLMTQRITDTAKRTFCGACGAPITMEYHATPQTVWLVVGTIDVDSVKGELPKVSEHIFLKEKLDWDILPDDGAARYDEWSNEDDAPGSPGIQENARG